MATQGISGKYVEGLRLSERERSMLIEQMKKTGVADRRKSPRIVLEGTFSVLLTMETPGGSTAHFRIYPWDLSRGGLGFFHRAFVYPGTHCTFTGLTFDGEPFTIKGEVVRCAHVAGNVHAVGTKLDAEIDPEKFLGSGTGAVDNGRTDDWWTHVVTRAAAISKLGRERAAPDQVRKAAEALMLHLATDPSESAAPIPAPAPVAESNTGPNAPAHAATANHPDATEPAAVAKAA